MKLQNVTEIALVAELLLMVEVVENSVIFTQPIALSKI